MNIPSKKIFSKPRGEKVGEEFRRENTPPYTELNLRENIAEIAKSIKTQNKVSIQINS